MKNEKQTEYIRLADEYMKEHLKCELEDLKGLFNSMSYSVELGGKRVRPVLCLMFCEACGGEIRRAVPLACAVEFIHTYSLIHDDLPCMDNDDFRRGKPSNHKVFGEANAVLAGDALLTEAFSLISEGFENGLYSAETAVKAVSALSEFAGPLGMVGGQYIDLSGEGQAFDKEKLELMDKLKTGALISASCVLGCLCAGADEQKIKAAEKYAEDIGLAFQIIDDILDVTGSFEKLGKQTGSDTENDKSTYVSLLGIEKCRELVSRLTEDAKKQIEVFENRAMLSEFADYLTQRDK